MSLAFDGINFLLPNKMYYASAASFNFCQTFTIAYVSSSQYFSKDLHANSCSSGAMSFLGGRCSLLLHHYVHYLPSYDSQVLGHLGKEPEVHSLC